MQIIGVLRALEPVPTEIGDESLMGVSESEEEQSLGPRVLHGLQERSLRAQCAKIVAGRPAMVPFGGNQ